MLIVKKAAASTFSCIFMKNLVLITVFVVTLFCLGTVRNETAGQDRVRNETAGQRQEHESKALTESGSDAEPRGSPLRHRSSGNSTTSPT